MIKPKELMTQQFDQKKNGKQTQNDKKKYFQEKNVFDGVLISLPLYTDYTYFT